MELVNGQGEPIKSELGTSDIKKAKASDLSRKHLNSPGATNRTFDTMADLEASANSIYAKAVDSIAEQYEKDKALGLDVNNMESIMAFEPGYTPIADTILVKFIREEQNIGNLILPDTTNENKKAVVITPGLLITSLFKGDIILMKGTDRNNPFPPTYKRMIKGISFEEIPYDAVSGVYDRRDDRLDRIRKEQLRDTKNGN